MKDVRMYMQIHTERHTQRLKERGEKGREEKGRSGQSSLSYACNGLLVRPKPGAKNSFSVSCGNGKNQLFESSFVASQGLNCKKLESGARARIQTQVLYCGMQMLQLVSLSQPPLSVVPGKCNMGCYQTFLNISTAVLIIVSNCICVNVSLLCSSKIQQDTFVSCMFNTMPSRQQMFQ